MTQILRFKAKITPNKTTTKNSQEKVFSGLFYKVRTNYDPTKPYNKSFINFVCSVRIRESIAFGFYLKNLRQCFPIQTSHSVNKSLLLIIRRFIFLEVLIGVKG